MFLHLWGISSPEEKELMIENFRDKICIVCGGIIDGEYKYGYRNSFVEDDEEFFVNSEGIPFRIYGMIHKECPDTVLCEGKQEIHGPRSVFCSKDDYMMLRVGPNGEEKALCKVCSFDEYLFGSYFVCGICERNCMTIPKYQKFQTKFGLCIPCINEQKKINDNVDEYFNWNQQI